MLAIYIWVGVKTTYLSNFIANSGARDAAGRFASCVCCTGTACWNSAVEGPFVPPRLDDTGLLAIIKRGMMPSCLCAIVGRLSNLNAWSGCRGCCHPLKPGPGYSWGMIPFCLCAIVGRLLDCAFELFGGAFWTRSRPGIPSRGMIFPVFTKRMPTP